MGSGGRRNKTKALAAFTLSLLLALGAVATPARAADPDLRKAEQLVATGRAAEAYAILAPFEDELAGDPKFDYLLGISALDSGKPDKATLAFERVLAVNPNFAGARLDMARAYFQLGDIARAKSEFETVLKENPPEAARTTIVRYLQAIEQHEKSKKTSITAYVEGTLGRDDNVNNSTAVGQVAVPALGNLVFTLDAKNLKQGASYWLGAAGADAAHEVQPGVAVFGGVSGRYRSNAGADQFDVKSQEGHGGIAFTGQSTVFRVNVGAERFYLDQSVNRKTHSAGADWRYILDPGNSIQLFGQQVRYRFASEALRIQDFNQEIGGAGWLRLFADGRSAFSVTGFLGRERDLNGRADGNKAIEGARVGGQLNLREDIDLFASAGAQRGKYDRENVAFKALRLDKQADAVAGLIWRVSEGWSLRPQVLYIRNSSNIPIYSYERTDYSITVRRDFK